MVRIISEGWRIGIDHGGVSILLGVANYTDDFADARENETNVVYSQNINFMIGGKLYIAMFTFDRVVFKIGSQEVVALLKYCDGFNVTHTPVEYDGTNPTLDCNMTFEAIRVYPDIPCMSWCRSWAGARDARRPTAGIQGCGISQKPLGHPRAFRCDRMTGDTSVALVGSIIVAGLQR